MYFHLLYQLPAIVAGTTLVFYMSPVKIAPRAMPLVMFLVGLIVLALPAMPDLALALTLPAAWLANYLGIDYYNHEPVNVAPAVAKARSAAQAARGRVRKPEPVEVTQFATHAYPAPGDEADVDGDTDDTGSTNADAETSPAADLQERLKQTMSDPRLPAGLRSSASSGQHAPVRSYVPSLI